MVLRKSVLELAIRTSCISHVLPPKVIWTSREESRARAARERALALAPPFVCSSRVTAQMEKSRSLFWRQFFPQGLSLGQAQLVSNWNSVRSPSLYHIHEWLSSEITYPSPVLSRTSNLLRAIRGFRNPNLQVALTRARDVCKFAIIKTRKKLGRVRFCKDFWDRFCGRAGQLLANFFGPVPSNIPEVLAQDNSGQFLSRF